MYDQKKQETHVVSYSTPPSHARTKLEDGFNDLLEFAGVLLDLWARDRMLANSLHIVAAVHLGPFLRCLTFVNYPPPLANPISERVVSTDIPAGGLPGQLLTLGYPEIRGQCAALHGSGEFIEFIGKRSKFADGRIYRRWRCMIPIDRIQHLPTTRFTGLFGNQSLFDLLLGFRPSFIELGFG